MGKRDDLIAKYADALRERCGIEPDMALLEKVTLGCGPPIYDAGGERILSTDPAALETVKTNFLMRKLDLDDDPRLMEAIREVVALCDDPEDRPYRAVVYYVLVRHFGREDAYP